MLDEIQRGRWSSFVGKHHRACADRPDQWRRSLSASLSDAWLCFGAPSPLVMAVMDGSRPSKIGEGWLLRAAAVFAPAECWSACLSSALLRPGVIFEAGEEEEEATAAAERGAPAVKPRVDVVFRVFCRRFVGSQFMNGSLCHRVLCRREKRMPKQFFFFIGLDYTCHGILWI